MSKRSYGLGRSSNERVRDHPTSSLALLHKRSGPETSYIYFAITCCAQRRAGLTRMECGRRNVVVVPVGFTASFVWPAAAEVTNWRVLWFAFAEAVVLIGLSVWRVVSLKRFFEQKGSF